jgi:hypothetical protein
MQQLLTFLPQQTLRLCLFLFLILASLGSVNASPQQGPCVPPATLAPGPCNTCQEIRIFYCENDPQPDRLSTLLAQNPNYQAGATFKWYSDQNGLAGPAMATEPSLSLQQGRTQYYWVSQEIGGCESAKRRVKVRFRRAPQLQVDSVVTICEGVILNLHTRVEDTRQLADQFRYYQVDAAGNASLFGTITASQGQLSPPGQLMIFDPNGPDSLLVVAENVFNLGPGCADTAGMRIHQQAPPQITPNQDVTICPGDTVTPPQVISPVTPQVSFWLTDQTLWGPGSMGLGDPPSFVAPTQATGPTQLTLAYYVAADYCIAIDTVVFTLAETPILQSGLSEEVCSGEQASLSLAVNQQGIGPYQYRWDAPSLAAGLGGQALAGSGPTLTDAFQNTTSQKLQAQYQVTPISGAGCKGAPGLVTLEVKPEPVLQPGLQQNLCSGQAASLPLSLSNQPPGPLSFSWPAPQLGPGLNGPGTGGSGASIQDVLLNSSGQPQTATYQVTPFAGGCLGQTGSVSLQVDPLPIAQPLNVAVCEDQPGSNRATLNLSQLLLDQGLSGNAGFFADAGLQQPLANPQAFQATGQTLYAAITGSGVCPDIRALNISISPQPTAPQLPALAGCEGSRFGLEPGGPFPFNFYDTDPRSGTANLLQGAATRLDTLLSLANQPVELWLTTLDGQCESQPLRASISVLPTPQLSQVTANSPLCETDVLQLNATAPGASLAWSGPGGWLEAGNAPQRQNIGLADTGIYRVEARLSNGCTTRDSLQVEVIALPSAGQSAILRLCTGDGPVSLFDALGGQPDSSGFWAGPSALPAGFQGSFDLGQHAPGRYTYQVPAIGCGRNVTAVVEVQEFGYPVPQLFASSPVFEEDELVLIANGGLTYQWSGPNGFAAQGSNVSRRPISLADSGFYVVKVGNLAGCEATDSIEVKVTPVPKVVVTLGAWLEGPFDPNTGLMWDSLRSKGYLPLQEPLSGAGFPLSGGGGESLDPQVLQVSGPDAIVDWVYVELRDENDSSRQVASLPALIQRDGDIVGLDGQSALSFRFVKPGNYYVFVDHRNHLAVMSGIPVSLNAKAGLPVDFRDVSTPTFGFMPLRVEGSRALLYTGDANGDDQVQVVDLIRFWTSQVGAQGYLEADWDLDGEVQNTDFLFYWIPNSGRGSQTPPRE